MRVRSLASQFILFAVFAALCFPSASLAASKPVPAASPTPSPFVLPPGPEEVPTISMERIITGAVGGLLAGFGIGMVAGIIDNHWRYQHQTGLPTLSDGALKQGLRLSGPGAFVFSIVFGSYAAYTTPAPPTRDAYPWELGNRSRREGKDAFSSSLAALDPMAASVEDVEQFRKNHSSTWISGIEQDGERLVVRVSDTFDTVPASEERKKLVALFQAYQAARKDHGLPPATELWLRGPSFLQRWSPPEE